MKQRTERQCRYVIGVRRLLLALLLLLGWQQASLAATGWCSANNGEHIFSFDATQTITTPEDNHAGFIAPDRTWDLGSTYSVTCSCLTSNPDYFASQGTVPSNLSFYQTIGDYDYYSIDEYLAAGVQYWVGSEGRYVKPPHTTTDPSGAPNNICTPPGAGAFAVGAKGKLSLLIKRAFVGQHVIPSTSVLDVKMTTIQGNYPPTPVAAVFISGVVTVPQSCKINDGQVIDVDFGTIMNTAFKTKGAGPADYTAKVTQLAYVCTNISEGVRLSFTFTGQTAAGDTNSLATNNSDIGVRLEDMNGVTVTPVSGKLPAQFDYASQSGTTSFKSYPVNTTGKVPATGNFSSTATITTNIE